MSPSPLLSKLAVSRLQNSGVQKEVEKGDGWLAPHNATGRIIAWSFQSIPSLHTSIFRHTAQPLISVMDCDSVVHQGRWVRVRGGGIRLSLCQKNIDTENPVSNDLVDVGTCLKAPSSPICTPTTCTYLVTLLPCVLGSLLRFEMTVNCLEATCTIAISIWSSAQLRRFYGQLEL